MKIYCIIFIWVFVIFATPVFFYYTLRLWYGMRDFYWLFRKLPWWGVLLLVLFISPFIIVCWHNPKGFVDWCIVLPANLCWVMGFVLALCMYFYIPLCDKIKNAIGILQNNLAVVIVSKSSLTPSIFFRNVPISFSKMLKGVFDKRAKQLPQFIISGSCYDYDKKMLSRLNATANGHFYFDGDGDMNHVVTRAFKRYGTNMFYIILTDDVREQIILEALVREQELTSHYKFKITSFQNFIVAFVKFSKYHDDDWLRIGLAEAKGEDQF